MAKTAVSIQAILIAFIATSQLAGCGTQLPMEVSDKHTRSVMASAVWRPEQLVHRGSPGRIENRGGVEVGYERFVADGTQGLTAAYHVQADGNRIDGPQALDNTAEVSRIFAGYDHFLKFRQHFELEPFLVATYARFHVTSRGTTPATAVISHTQNGLGVAVGIMPRWNFNQYLAAEMQGRVSADGGGTISSLFAPALVAHPQKNIAINLGYIWYSSDIETPFNTSNVSLDLQGFNLALRLNF